MAECQWYLNCHNEATLTRPHPILGGVPICARCDKLCDDLQAATQRPTQPDRPTPELEPGQCERCFRTDVMRDGKCRSCGFVDWAAADNGRTDDTERSRREL
jgi:hypothetical protein